MKMTRRQLGWLLASETFFLALLAVWVLSRLDRLFEPAALTIALAIIVFGDLVTALVMQRFTTPHITVSPGETAGAPGRVISGFSGSAKGRVSVRGERWRARTHAATSLAPGDPVRVVGRQGLTLIVKPFE